MSEYIMGHGSAHYLSDRATRKKKQPLGFMPEGSYDPTPRSDVPPDPNPETRGVPKPKREKAKA